jgi:hypothetical protein
MNFEQHCEESERLFGKPYAEVHRWLDELMGKGLGAKHRRKRHHQAGIRQVAELFGEEAGRVAKQHIISDLKEEGWTESDPFPRDEEHYDKMGLFCLNGHKGRVMALLSSPLPQPRYLRPSLIPLNSRLGLPM